MHFIKICEIFVKTALVEMHLNEMCAFPNIAERELCRC